MLEKAIVALRLMGHLGETGLPIQFERGTSLFYGTLGRLWDGQWDG
jgi:hypothetical protein